ncbi:cytochrome c biogenesis heme-transporting ATPase CcmA [Reyranella sp. MMS21-HV4-11]|uniref:Cytochrome c biogenesis heme-transporting ATPase CcmA n=1 Tax=Reyranella humidisoli TaxID=2849149 RepID=A0ABS6IFU3_9HYPH|nr:heme ABC exporter ATP-binding protein CcmA [Reyranella sp. MMS21-HV4-11]MBU8873340.1 cytochrome c biogenesis heme-transporting ATPase CcmA [Reyranella sp. MMS21-HV4-11]
MAPPLLEVTGLSCRRGGRLVFDRLSFALGEGELLALTGRNGSGKTSLLRALAGLTPPHAGTIAWQGADISLDPETWRGRLAWLGHLEGLKGDLTVMENLVFAERLRGGEAGDRLEWALVALDLIGLSAREVRTLSAGQRRRTALARIVLSQAPLWLLDEPLNALDVPAQAAFRTALQRHLAAGGLAIAATHAELGIEGRSLELGPALSSTSPPLGGEAG